MPCFARIEDQFEARSCKDLFQVLFVIFDNIKPKDNGNEDFPDMFDFS